MTSVVVQGIEVPQIGLGTWDLRGETCRRAVASALAIGYRHVDTAEFYRNETEIGQALSNSGVARSKVFITSKVWSNHLRTEEVVRACEASLANLGTDYLDLYLVHWPSSSVPIEETMAGMQNLLDQGKARTVGVSNYSVDQLRRADSALEGRVFCNQVRYNVRYSQSAMAEICRSRDVLLAAYTPLAKGQLDLEPVLLRIGESHGKTAHQVALRWLIQQENVAAIPKAASEAHQRENLDVFDFELTKTEMEQIAAIAG